MEKRNRELMAVTPSSQDDRVCCMYSKILQEIEPFVQLRLFFKCVIITSVIV